MVAAHGRQYLVELQDGQIVSCFPRGKRSGLACGDRVAVLLTAPGQGVIEATDPRRTLLYRSDLYRQKLIAANVDQMVMVVAAVPSFYEELLDRCLVAAEHQHLRVLIVLNKFDLDASAAAMQRLQRYASLGYEVLPLVARHDVAPLRPRLDGCISVLVGQSGMGKSTIVNALVPQARAAVGDVSTALDSGRHTTTHARLYRLDHTSALIDSPGMQEFGLKHVTLEELPHGFMEFRPWLGQCRFNDCRHLSEPGCAIQAAAECGKIGTQRLAVYRKLAHEAQRRPRY
ncbi:MAG: ribosome small subunit-dependent GTPase A [Burkholderiales bacterium]|nr:ribosome small subunit-dependent GTPase A [Burkholderiales bacterium]